MADPEASESVLKWALGGLATFLGGVIVWDRSRAATVQDREFLSREVYTKELARLPGALDAMAATVEDMKRRLGEAEDKATRAEALALALERRVEAEKKP